MFQQFYEPHPALKGFVNKIMMHALKVDAAEAPLNFSIPPLPAQGLIFYVRDQAYSEVISSGKRETLPNSLIVGPNTNRHIITPGKDHLVINVEFQPAGLYRLLGIPMNELLYNDVVDGADLLGTEMNEISDQLSSADSYNRMKIIIENFLLKRIIKLKPILPIDHALSVLINEKGYLKLINWQLMPV